MAQPIQTRLRLTFTDAENDATESLLPDLLSFSYSDKENMEADELDISLKDPDGDWAARFRSVSGEVVRAYIIQGSIENPGPELYCGAFYVDSMSVSGAPRVFSLKATSIPLDKPLRRKIKTRAWQKKTLGDILIQIADENDLFPYLDAMDGPVLDRQEQNRESDLGFLARLCEENGYSIKVTDRNIVVFDQASYEAKDPVKVFTIGESPILSWSFDSAQSETYKSVKLSYRDIRAKKAQKASKYDLGYDPRAKKGGKSPVIVEYTYTDPDAGEQGQEFEWKKRAENKADAERLAKAKLRELNRRSVTGSMSVVGDVSLVAGEVIEVRNAGSFDGKFIIEEASHSVDGGGYVTALTLRRVNNNY